MGSRGSIYDAPAKPAESRPGLFYDRPHLPYIIPLLAFLLVMSPTMLGTVGGIDFSALWKTYHPLVYGGKSVLAAVLLVALWKYYTRIRWTHLTTGVIVGLLLVPQWILCEYASQRLHISAPPAPSDMYNPDLQIGDPMLRYLFLFVRVAGPTLVVPFMEELVYRDFLMRAFIAGSHFEDVEVGTFSRKDWRSWASLFGTALIFTLSHIQRPSAFVWGLAMGVLVIRTKSLGACIVAHGVTNLVLYLYVIYSGDWQFM